ncbi:ParB/RepB/Spo0J family partition protein [Cellulomonas sp. ACRRI]|uniref:ParB/RepB/Spo0J family partition protein n=1 Tax=Cellulomonas sp. ACRRI TaxID=2918188 RepID=UPI001EF1FF9C|nr:ParB/RepB/Spo0J family partition protein [Cellulomonas sp. ACRRI]MCG7285976.1 ParB/RepB/Spo0J family partition protein [Cellulomonas sp. ACRRI]
MSEKRRGLGRGLGALIPTGAEPREGDRPVDVFFPDRTTADDRGPRSDALTSRDTRGATEAPPDGAPVDHRAPSARAATAAPAPAAAAPRSNGRKGVPSLTVRQPARTRSQAPAGPAPADEVPPMPPTAEVDDLVPVPGAVFAELPVGSIRPNPRQPRSVFDEDALDELVGSIREIGVLQPVVVRAVDDGYELIMGERRWRATQAAGLDTIPAIVRQTEDADLLRDALLENLHRSQLNPLEEAAAYQQLLDDFGCTHDELARRIHRSRPQISNTLRLLRLPPLVQRRVAAGVLSAGHARALLGLSDGAAIERLAQRIVAEGLSVRAVEEIVALGAEDGTPKRRRPRAGLRNEALDDLASRLSDRFETRVKVDLGKQRGKLTVEFASVQDLNRILSSLAPDDPGILRS